MYFNDYTYNYKKLRFLEYVIIGGGGGGCSLNMFDDDEVSNGLNNDDVIYGRPFYKGSITFLNTCTHDPL